MYAGSSLSVSFLSAHMGRRGNPKFLVAAWLVHNDTDPRFQVLFIGGVQEQQEIQPVGWHRAQNV